MAGLFCFRNFAALKKQIQFIINPISGVGQKKGILKTIDKYIDHSKFDYQIVYTEGPKHALSLAEEAAQKGVHCVVAVGGDGSVHEAGVPLIGTETALAIIPAGSGNGLARHLNIPLKHKHAIERINNFNIQTIDTGLVNGTPFINLAGVGFDAFIGWKFASFRSRGFISYIWVSLKEYTRYKPKDYVIEVNGERLEKQAFAIAIANASQWGNNAVIAPQASVSDGYLDLAIVDKFPPTMLAYMGLMLFTSTADKSDYVQHFHTKTLKITQPTVLAHVDGEPIKLGRELEFSVNPQSLKIVV